jgi:hypothetical protein
MIKILNNDGGKNDNKKQLMVPPLLKARRKSMNATQATFDNFASKSPDGLLVPSTNK